MVKSKSATTGHADDSRLRYRDAFAVPEFRVLFASHVISMLGTVIAEFSLSVLVYRRTGSPLLTALVFALAFTPHLFAGALFSSLVDRVPARRLLVSCNLATTLLAAAMAMPGMPVFALLCLVFIMGSISPIFAGTRAATLAEILPDSAYVPGRSLFRLVAQGSQIVGFAGGGLLLVVVSPSSALWIQSAMFLISAVLLRVGTARRPIGVHTSSSLLRDSITGLRGILAIGPLRRILFLGWAVPALSVFAEALANPYAHAHGFTSVELGIMMAMLPLGTVLGEFLAMWRLTASRQCGLVPYLAAWVFVPVLSFWFQPSFAIVAPILLLSGMGFAYHLGLDRLLIKVTPEQLRSRALAVQTAGLMFWQGLGFVTAGALAQFAPASAVVSVSGAVGLLATVCLRPRTKDIQPSASTASGAPRIQAPRGRLRSDRRA
ncbi:MFS transporter [Nocardia suismassiliense]|uniref:MFS transporter n=1 Tax=Nocardia suismassiliense TaxID=2077092 RepID=A0ABW6QVL1_9NOCA